MPVIPATASPPSLMRMAVPGVLVPGLGHDELERDFGVAEAGRGAVPELTELQAGVVAQQDAAAA